MHTIIEYGLALALLHSCPGGLTLFKQNLGSELLHSTEYVGKTMS
jgi:hypothetical protein